MLLAALLAAIAATIVHGASILADAAALRGERDFELFAAMGLVPLGVVLVVLVAVLPLLAFAKTRGAARVVVVACVAYASIAAVLIPIGKKLRLSAFSRAAHAAEPLVQALHRFEDDHGRPPAELDELVPRYLGRIPGTGIPAFPQFEFDSGPHVPAQYHGNRWVLWIDLATTENETLYYLPHRDYDDRHDERVGKWAYVSE
jgi:hypothetical protein